MLSMKLLVECIKMYLLDGNVAVFQRLEKRRAIENGVGRRRIARTLVVWSCHSTSLGASRAARRANGQMKGVFYNSNRRHQSRVEKQFVGFRGV